MGNVVLLDEVGLYTLPARHIELFVVQADVYAALEGLVEGVYAVGSEEHDAFVVLQHAEEDGDELVPLEFVEGALFKEDIGFVEEEDSISAITHVEDALKS